MRKPIRRRALLAGAALALPLPALGQPGFPTRSVRVIVAYGAGGTADATARILFAKVSELLGQQFVIENRPGAGGTLGANAVFRAAPVRSSACRSSRLIS